MSNLIPPHGGKGLTCRLLKGKKLAEEKKKAKSLKKTRESVDKRLSWRAA